MFHFIRGTITFLSNGHYSGKSDNSKTEKNKENSRNKEVRAWEAIIAPDNDDGDEADGKYDVVKIWCIGNELLFAGGVLDHANSPVSDGNLKAKLQKSKVNIDGFAFRLVNICFHFLI